MKRRKVWRMSCDIGKATEGLENELWRRRSNGRVREWAVMHVKRQKDWRMNYDVGEATEEVGGRGSTHSPTLPSLHLRHSSFSLAHPAVSSSTSKLIIQPSVASPTSQLVLQPFCRFTYVTRTSPMTPGEPPMSQNPPPKTKFYTFSTSISQEVH